MMNWLDAFLAAVVVFSALAGAQKGLVRQLFGLIGTVVSYLVAVHYSNALVLQFGKIIPLTRWFPQWFQHPLLFGFSLGDVVLRLLAFFLLFSLVSVIFALAGNTVHALFTLPLLGLANRAGGMLLGAVQGVLVVLVLVAAARFIQLPFLAEALEKSMFADRIFAMMPLVYEQMKAWLFLNRPL